MRHELIGPAASLRAPLPVFPAKLLVRRPAAARRYALRSRGGGVMAAARAWAWPLCPACARPPATNASAAQAARRPHALAARAERAPCGDPPVEGVVPGSAAAGACSCSGHATSSTSSPRAAAGRTRGLGGRPIRTGRARPAARDRGGPMRAWVRGCCPTRSRRRPPAHEHTLTALTCWRSAAVRAGPDRWRRHSVHVIASKPLAVLRGCGAHSSHPPKASSVTPTARLARCMHAPL